MHTARAHTAVFPRNTLARRLATPPARLVAGRVLRPLRRMTDTARRIAEAPAADRNLHESIALNGPEDELEWLADTFDLMLERLDH
ncbi:HAMP domain-containing protein [Embleya sp. NPDC020630]|uniref:HAMP domain-containing protein n=1 Tax=Embleya sp. NPDC020630 TaxID=3363979 RepID=UPI00379F72C7